MVIENRFNFQIFVQCAEKPILKSLSISDEVLSKFGVCGTPEYRRVTSKDSRKMGIEWPDKCNISSNKTGFGSVTRAGEFFLHGHPPQLNSVGSGVVWVMGLFWKATILGGLYRGVPLYVNIDSGNGLVPSGNKPLIEPVLTKISDAICHHYRPQWVNDFYLYVWHMTFVLAYHEIKQLPMPCVSLHWFWWKLGYLSGNHFWKKTENRGLYSGCVPSFIWQ